MSSRNTDLATIKEWQELGFFYDYCDQKMEWHLKGDRKGLLRFSKMIQSYANNPKNKELGEHEHFGPYFYLKITTGPTPLIDRNGWAGTIENFHKLASLIEQQLTRSTKQEFVVSKEFAPNSTSVIRFEIAEDGFDPSSEDTSIKYR